MRASLCFLLFLVLLVLKFTIIHDFRNRRDCVRGNLNEIKPEFCSFFQCVREGKNPQNLARIRDNTELFGVDLVIDFYLRNQGILRKLTTRKCIAESYGLYVISKLKSIVGVGQGGIKVFNRSVLLQLKNLLYYICHGGGTH